MRTWKKFIAAAAAVVVYALVLTGCGGEQIPAMDTVSVQKDGTIKHTIVGQFERHYYDVDGLNEMAKEKVDRYNGGTGSVVCESVEKNDTQVVIRMTYQTGEDYTEFNNRELFYGTVSEASAQGYSFQDMVGTDGNAKSKEEILAAGENHVVIVQTNKGEALDVNVYDKILYASGHITLSGKTDAIIAESEEDRMSYIIFQ